MSHESSPLLNSIVRFAMVAILIGIVCIAAAQGVGQLMRGDIIAFSRGIVDLNSGIIVQFIGGAFDIAWSPNGENVAFTRYEDGFRIYVADQYANNPHRLIDNSNFQFEVCPAWSPDGTKIVFVASDERSAIYIFELSTNDVWLLTEIDDEASCPAWSADGQQIVFSNLDNWEAAIQPLYYIDVIERDYVAPTDWRQPIYPVTKAFEPTWSPTGTQILFTDSDGAYMQLFMIDIDGSDMHQLTFLSPDHVFEPVWSYDSTQIAFTRYMSPAGQEIFVMNTDGSNMRQLTNCIGDCRNPAWMP
jgi:TolB protein